jgi:hypothetical protein
MSQERFTYQKAAGINSAAYAAHVWEVRLTQCEIGPGAETGRSGGTELGSSGGNVIESPDYLSMRVAELKRKPRSRGLGSRGTNPQLPQRLLDDDAKPADAQGDISDSRKGCGNGSDS